MSDRSFFGIKKKNKILDKVTKERLLFAVEQGSYVKDACIYAGIDESTFYRWRQKAESGEETYVELFDEIAQIEAEFKVYTVKKIKDIGEEDRNPRALQWILEKSKLVISTEENVINVIEFADGTIANNLPDGVIDELDMQDMQVEEQEKVNDAKIDDYD